MISDKVDSFKKSSVFFILVFIVDRRSQLNLQLQSLVIQIYTYSRK